MKIKEFFKSNKHIYLFMLLIPIVLYYFILQLRQVDYTILHLAVDDYIPFIPLFVIPYILWYLYVPLHLLITGLNDRNAFYKQCIAFFSGVVICLIVFTILPTAIDFRPNVDKNGFIFWLCRVIYANDKPVNVCPSLHCYEAVCLYITTFSSEKLKKFKAIRIISAILMVLICLSTVFIKQHSVLDVLLGSLLAVIISYVVLKFKKSH